MLFANVELSLRSADFLYLATVESRQSQRKAGIPGWEFLDLVKVDIGRIEGLGVLQL